MRATCVHRYTKIRKHTCTETHTQLLASEELTISKTWVYGLPKIKDGQGLIFISLKTVIHSRLKHRQHCKTSRKSATITTLWTVDPKTEAHWSTRQLRRLLVISKNQRTLTECVLLANFFFFNISLRGVLPSKCVTTTSRKQFQAAPWVPQERRLPGYTWSIEGQGSYPTRILSLSLPSFYLLFLPPWFIC